jgi:hypothetical protein
MRSKSAGTEVNDAIGRIQQPRIGVPLTDRRGQSAIRPREPFNRGDSLSACDRDFVVVAGRRSMSTRHADVVISRERVVELPIRSCSR